MGHIESVLCYCSSLPGTPCDFCSGLREATPDLYKRVVREKAEIIWRDMDKNQRTGVRIGLFPAEVMREAEAEGYTGKASTDLAVALMDCTKANGGMIA